jgi:hypothetical protein
MKKLRRTTKNTGWCRAYHHKNNYLHISNVVVATSDYIGALDHNIQDPKGENSRSSNATLRSVGLSTTKFMNKAQPRGTYRRKTRPD